MCICTNLVPLVGIFFSTSPSKLCLISINCQFLGSWESSSKTPVQIAPKAPNPEPACRMCHCWAHCQRKS